MVKYSGRGLVSRGSVDLKLLKILFWLITLSCIAFAYGNMPLSRQLKPGFPENTVIGMICLRQEIQYSKDSIKARMLGFAFPVINLFAVCSWRRKVVKYINGQCLNKNTFSAFGGKYRRNIFTFAETLNYNLCWCIFIILENMLLIGLELHSEEVNQELSYYAHHIMCIIFVDIFHGIYLPLKHLNSIRDLFQNIKQNKSNFHVRVPKMVPRRDIVETKQNSAPKEIHEGSVFDLDNFFQKDSRRNNSTTYLDTIYEHEALPDIEM
jgi:hypothetical protein